MSFEFLIDDKDKASAEFMTKVHRVLMREMAKVAKERKLSKSDLARLLDIDRSAVSRALNGKANLTIRTVSDLCWAMGVEPTFDACEAVSKAGCNHEPHKTDRQFVSARVKSYEYEQNLDTHHRPKKGFGGVNVVRFANGN